MRVDNGPQEATERPLTREILARTRRKALRRRYWYKVLSTLERGIVDLAIRCVAEVKSLKLRTALRKILGKLIHAFGAGYFDMVENVGRPLAAHISHVAQSWGNKEAAEWKHDPAFIRYLGFNKLSARMFG